MVPGVQQLSALSSSERFLRPLTGACFGTAVLAGRSIDLSSILSRAMYEYSFFLLSEFVRDCLPFSLVLHPTLSCLIC